MSGFQNLEDLVEPFVLDKALDWDILKMDINEWNVLLKGEELEFRMGEAKHSQKPQWENTCKRIHGTFEDFLEFSRNESNSESWLYFDYKYLKSIFVNTDGLRNCIKWDKIGISGKSCDESVIWIGNKGAHTPCHLDTYGCNFVAQIYGRKLWLLFPPNQDLRPTRVPYEESSIYSQMNFYSPTNVEDFKDIKQCRTVILEPGQVLFVPKGWWHYVENLEIAISVNIWLTLPSDDEKRINEAVTLALVTAFTNSMSIEEKQAILNSPDVDLPNTEASLRYVNHFVEKFKEAKAADKINQTEVKAFDQKIIKLDELNQIEFLDIIKKNSQRFINTHKEKDNTEEKNIQTDVLRAITDPEVVEMIKKKLLKK